VKRGGRWRSGLPTTGGVWPRHRPRTVQGARKTQSRDVAHARAPCASWQLTNFGVHLHGVVHRALGHDAPLAVTAMGGKFAIEDNRG
jgi:hypothetical protein